MMKNRLLILFLPLLLSVVPAAAKGLSAEKAEGDFADAHPHPRPRGGGLQDERHTGRRRRQPPDALRLDRHVLLSLPRAERGGDLRLDPQPAARLARPSALVARDGQAPDRGVDSADLPQRQPGQDLHQPFGPSAGDPPVVARETDARTRGAPHSDVAEPRPLFRSGGEPLALAAFAAVGDLRRPLHAKLRAALSGADARTGGSQRAVAARTRRADRGGDRRQRCRRGRRIVLRRIHRRPPLVRRGNGIRTPARGLRRVPEPLCGGDDTRRADRNRRPREPCRMERRPARERRIRRLRLLQDGRTQFGGCPLHGAPSGWREPFRGQSDHGRRHMDLSGDIPLRGGTKSCVGHAEQPLVEKRTAS